MIGSTRPRPRGRNAWRGVLVLLILAPLAGAAGPSRVTPAVPRPATAPAAAPVAAPAVEPAVEMETRTGDFEAAWPLPPERETTKLVRLVVQRGGVPVVP